MLNEILLNNTSYLKKKSKALKKQTLNPPTKKTYGLAKLAESKMKIDLKMYIIIK